MALHSMWFDTYGSIRYMLRYMWHSMVHITVHVELYEMYRDTHGTIDAYRNTLSTI